MVTTAKIFMNGGSQAVRLPKEFRFDSDEVCIKRIGSAVVIFDPRDRRGLLESALGRASDDFLHNRNQPPAAEERPPL